MEESWEAVDATYNFGCLPFAATWIQLFLLIFSMKLNILLYQSPEVIYK